MQKNSMSRFKNRKDPDTDTSHLSKDMGKHAASAFKSVAVAQVLANIIGLGGTIVLARLMGPEEFGLMAMLATAVALLSVFENFGLYFATIQKKVLSADELNFLFWANLIVASLIAAIMFFSSPFLAAFFNEPELIPLSQVLALAFICRGAANQHAALLNRKLQHGKSSLATVGGVFFATVGAVILALYGFGVWALVWRQVIEAFVRGVILWALTGWFPRWVKWNKEFLNSMKFGASITFSGLMNYTSRNMDDILIGKFLGATQLGFYKLSYQILLLPLTRISTPVSQVMIPILSQLQDDAERYRKNFARASHALIIIQLPIAISFIFHAPILVTFIFGEQWLPAAEPLRWLAASLMIQGLSNSTGWLFISQARSKEMFYWSIFSSVTTVISFIVGLSYGITGVAAAYVICGYLRTPILFFVCGRNGPVRTSDLYDILLTHVPVIFLFSLVNYVVALYVVDKDLLINVFLIALAGLSYFPLAMTPPKNRAIMLDTYKFIKERKSVKKA
jgi:PST family polysaccharide transporter